jgi:hypothetical protein
MRRWLVVVAVLAGCGGVESASPEPGGAEGPPCYRYVVNLETGETATHCTDAEAFCWWATGSPIDDPDHECSPDLHAVLCYDIAQDAQSAYCALYSCFVGMVNNDRCCHDGQVVYLRDGRTGPWDGVYQAQCVDD